MPENMTTALAFILGFAWGSFLNVCIARLPKGEDLFFQRSSCPACHTQLRWHQNIPVLSWIALRGKCASCQAPIPLLYPFIEFGTGCVIGVSTLNFGGSVELALFLLFFSSLLVASVIDIQLQIIPNRLTYPFLFLGWGQAFIAQITLFANFSQSVLGSIGGGGMLWSVAKLYRKIRAKEGIGLGDAKFLAMIGAWLGWEAIPLILVIASTSALLLATISMVQKRITWDTPLPFGPFLSLGRAVYLFIQDSF